MHAMIERFLPFPSMRKGRGGGNDWHSLPPTCFLPRKRGGDVKD